MNDYTGTENLEVMAEAINYNRFLVDLVSGLSRAGTTTVDFGAGLGTFAQPLHDQGRRVLCVEPDAAQFRVLTDKGWTACTSINEIAANSVDYLYTLNVLEHIDDDRQALYAIRRTLKDDALLLVYVPAFAVLYTDMDRKVGHVRRYRLQELVDKVRGAGFDIDSAEYVDCLGFLATLVYKWTDRSSGQINRQALRQYDRIVFPISRALDTLGARRMFGKNVLLVARARPAI